MTDKNVIISNFNQIAETDANLNITGITTANITANGNVSLGSNANVRIQGGLPGQFLATDGNGNLSWTNQVMSSIVVTNITRANPGVVTTQAPHGLPNGQPIVINGVTGMTQINGQALYARTGSPYLANTFALYTNGNLANTLNTSLFSPYSTPNTGVVSTRQDAASYIANGFSNIAIATANGNMTATINGFANIWTVTETGIVLGNFSNHRLGNVSNLKISGGSNGQILTTDGNGNLSWQSPTANIIRNGTSNVAINAVNGNVTLAVAGSNLVNFATTGVQINTALTSNSLSTNSAIVNGNITQLQGTANLTGAANVVLNTPNLQFYSNITGLTFPNVGDILVANANGRPIWQSPQQANITKIQNGNTVVNIAAPNSNVTFSYNALPNVYVFANNSAVMNANVTVGNLVSNTNANTTNLTVIGNANLQTALSINLGNAINRVKLSGGSNTQILSTDGTGNLSWVNQNFVSLTPIVYATEKIVQVTGTQPATFTLNVLDAGVQFYTPNLTANANINIRGNATTALSSVLAANQSITVTQLVNVGSNAFGITNLLIDGGITPVKYAGGYTPPITSVTASYTFTIVKTAEPATYTVLGSITEYAL